MTISFHDHIQDWSIARSLTSVTHDTGPYFFVNGGQDFHGLLLQASIGLRKYFLCPYTPFGQQGILCASARIGDTGIDTLCSNQYSLVDKRIDEEIKGQTFSKHCFVPRIDKLLHSRSLHQSVREDVVGLLRCTGAGDVTVYLDNFTFLLPLCDTSFQSRTGNLVFGLLMVCVPLVIFVSHLNESDLLRPVIFLALHYTRAT
jgi:hypothetical protein